MKNLKKQKKLAFLNRCKIFTVRTSNPLTENASSAEGTSAGGTSTAGTSAEAQHKESTGTHVSRNKI